MHQLTEHVFITSVLNPSMRIFDVTMRTEFGTSYNSYVVLGEAKTALVDTAHAGFVSYYFDNIDEVLQGKVPDYLVMNHCEPDHSGSVAAILERYPDITIVVSKAGSIYLKNITNMSGYKVQVAADGDTLDLGGIELRFVLAPFLHWPDTMFTWLEADGVLFTCDFMGAHYCEPQFIDSKTADTACYQRAIEEYYDAILSPFAPYVLQGLEKLSGLDPLFAATSHGPILTRGVMLEWVSERYAAWVAVPGRDKPRIPVFYASAYGNTRRIALSVAEGIAAAVPGADVGCFDINGHDLATLSRLLNESDAFVVGSPTINRDAVAPIWHLLANIEAIGIAGRPCAVFGSYGWSGEAAGHLAARLESLRAKVYEEQFRVRFVPTPEDLEQARAFGAAFAATL